MVVHDFSVIACLFSGGVGVEVSTHVFDFNLQITDCASGGSFKGHVLKEVGRAVGGVGLISAASIDPNTNSGGARVGDLFTDDTEAIWETGDLQIREEIGDDMTYIDDNKAMKWD